MNLAIENALGNALRYKALFGKAFELTHPEAD